ncbi:MAG TPA: pyridoxal-dependent decarboxylase [Rhizomicrobium sp.]|nr:pyridoxal-dependent decarboxylase [Rhizomicrobium sp.]
MDETLDPEDWNEARAQAHRMLDDMLDNLEGLRDQPVWRPMSQAVRARFRAPLPREPQSLDAVHADFLQDVLPHAGGNLHPGFMGWVQGGGTVTGMLAEMLAGGMNANLGGRDHSAIAVERQTVQWVREMFGFPQSAAGLFVTGTSIANFLAVLAARTRALGPGVRETGLGQDGARLCAYASEAAHLCVPRAFEMAGLGRRALRLVRMDAHQRMDLNDLSMRVRADRAAGLRPFMVVGSAGTVDAGAIDDLSALAQFCAEEGLWFHIDGAFGALGILSSQIAPRLVGIERADSLAFDFHKWGQVPYDAGFLLVREEKALLDTFATPAAYLKREARGMAAGSPWPCDLGPDLSRGFRALKTWFTLKTYGAGRIGRMIEKSCALARHLETRVRAESQLELLAPAQLNIVCFGYRGGDNAAIVADLQESGIAAPSLTRIGGRTAIRACFINHRTEIADVDAMVAAVLAFGRQRALAA